MDKFKSPYAANPSLELVEINSKRLAVSILENGKNATELTQIWLEMVAPTLTENFMYRNNARFLPANKGATEQISFMTRQGWSELDPELDYDFFGLQRAGFLSEKILKDKFLSANFEWDMKKLRLLPDPVKALADLIKTFIQKEFANEIEQRVVGMVEDAIENGVQNDDGTDTASAVKYNLSLNYLPETETDLNKNKFAIQAMKHQITQIWRIDNPLTLKPNVSEEYLAFTTPEFDQVVQGVAGYEVFGGDSVYASYLGNKPTKLLAKIPIMITPFQNQKYPLVVMRKRSYFLSIGQFDTRSDFVGTSTTKMFFKTDASYVGYKVSYWNTKFDGLFAWTDENIAYGSTNIKSNVKKTGVVNYEASIKGGEASTTDRYVLRLFNNYGTQIGTDSKITTDTSGNGDITTNETLATSQTIRTELWDIEAVPAHRLALSNYYQATNTGQGADPILANGPKTNVQAVDNSNADKEAAAKAKAIAEAEAAAKAKAIAEAEAAAKAKAIAEAEAAAKAKAKDSK